MTLSVSRISLGNVKTMISAAAYSLIIRFIPLLVPARILTIKSKFHMELTLRMINATDANDNGNLSGPGRLYRDPGWQRGNRIFYRGGANGGQSIGELWRQKVLDAYAITNIAGEVNVGYFDGGTGSGLPNWLNYTRTYPSGTYNVYLRVAEGGGALGRFT